MATGVRSALMNDAELAAHAARAWERFRALGSPTKVMAPMVNQSELAFRMLGLKHGCELVYSPMLHSELFSWNEQYRKRVFSTCEEDGPLVVQFCGNDAETLLAAARHVEGECVAVDINLGCPQGIARKGFYGAFLAANEVDWPRIQAMVSTLHQHLAVPVWAKIRLFPEGMETTLRFVDMLQRAGASLIGVHGRTKEMKGENTGVADWDAIRTVKEFASVPVYANGNIRSFADYERCLRETKTDGVLSACGLLANPMLFSGTTPLQHPADEDPTVPRKEYRHLTPEAAAAVAREYTDYAVQYKADPSQVRAHLFAILHALLPIHTDMRTALHRSPTIAGMRDVCVEIARRLDEGWDGLQEDEQQQPQRRDQSGDYDDDNDAIGGLFEEE